MLSGKSAYDLSPETTANWFKDAVSTPALQNYQENIQPQIAQGFAGVAGFSSAQGAAQARALSNMNVGLNQQLAQGQFQNQALAANLADSAANRQQTGVNAAFQSAQFPMQAALGYQQLLNPFQQNAQAQSAANYQDFLRTSSENNPWLQQAQAFLGQQGLFAYQAKNPIGGALGGALSGAAAGSAIPGIGTLFGGVLGGLGGLFA